MLIGLFERNRNQQKTLKLFFILCCFCGTSLIAQDYWSVAGVNSLQEQPITAFERILIWDQTTWETNQHGKTATGPKTILLPNEQGALEEFKLLPVALLAPEIAKKYPKIQTYTAHSASRENVHARLTVSPLGISAWLRLPHQEDVFIQPEKGAKGQHRVYQKAKATTKAAFLCKTSAMLLDKQQHLNIAQKTTGQEHLKTFRLALVASGEYTQYWDDADPSNGGAQDDAFAAVVNTINRINEVFETDLGIRLQLVTDGSLMYTDPLTDPFSNDLNQETQNTLTTEVGEANYDIGHLFGQEESSNGDAGCIGCVCVDNRKGQGYSIYPSSSNNYTFLSDHFDLDYAAHEMGHQFGAYHTFSYENENYGANVEPGSGSTIMGYAGITGSNNVQAHGDPYFHAKSIENITEYINTISCYSTSPINNQAPVVDAGSDYYIPIGTAYALTAAATDPEGDILYYTWEQMDDGTIGNDNFGPDNFTGALARSLPPTTNAVRSIPNTDAVLSGLLTQTNPGLDSRWETVANVARSMHWAVTVRDRFSNDTSNGGRTHRDDVLINVVDTETPFSITSTTNGSIWRIGAREKITWEVANTNLYPIQTETVAIYLSTDNGETFPHLLAANAPNTGEATITVPVNAATTAARLKIEANNNIFYAITPASFPIISRPFYVSFTNYEQLSCGGAVVNYDYTFTVLEALTGTANIQAIEVPDGVAVTITPTALSANTNGTISVTPSAEAAFGAQEIKFRIQNGTQTEEFSIQLNNFSETIIAPELTTPSDGAAEIGLQPTLHWQAHDNANTYRVEVTSTTFNELMYAQTTADTLFTISNLYPNQDYFWRVKAINPCGESLYSEINTFQTASINCKTFTTDGLPINIDDATQVSAGITRKNIYVENDNIIESVAVNLKLTHTYVSDLSIALIAPTGDRVVLAQNIGGQGSNFTDTVFQDTAATAITTATAPFTGVFQPMEPLEKFRGKSSFGNWTLEIIDAYVQDNGQLLELSLDLCLQGSLAQNTDGDTVIDALDNCPNVSNSNQNDYDNDGVGDVCDLDGQNNFSIYKTDETCLNKNNGSLQLSVVADFEYEVVLNGPSGYRREFTMNDSGLQINNLAAGDYLLCITSPVDLNFERCFATSILSPDIMQVQSVIHEPSQSLDLSVTGTSSFEVQLNGEKVNPAIVENKRIPLLKGANILRVINTTSCQEIYEKVVYLSEGLMVYPNPSSGNVNILAPEGVETIKLIIRAVDGAVLATAKEYTRTALGTFLLDMSSYPQGMYLLQVQTASGIETLKVIRK